LPTHTGNNKIKYDPSRKNQSSGGNNEIYVRADITVPSPTYGKAIPTTTDYRRYWQSIGQCGSTFETSESNNRKGYDCDWNDEVSGLKISFSLLVQIHHIN
jgi:hypothetical protein